MSIPKDVLLYLGSDTVNSSWKLDAVANANTTATSSNTAAAADSGVSGFDRNQVCVPFFCTVTFGFFASSYEKGWSAASAINIS